MSQPAPVGFGKLVLEGVRCFPSLELPLGPSITLIIGENGAGKTTIAEALASLCFGEDEGLSTFPLRRDASRGSIRLFDRAGREVASWNRGGVRRRLGSEQYLFAYGRYRRTIAETGPLTFDPQTGKAVAAPQAAEVHLTRDLDRAVFSRRTWTLFRSDELLQRGLRNILLEMHEGRRADSRWDVIWKSLEQSLSGVLDGFKVVERNERLVPVILRSGVEMELQELSDGYQSILAIVFDLTIRYFYLFTSLDNPLEGRATVVIDEVDLHLHPRWQRQIIHQLRRLFPNTQFVLMTHSPAVVQDAIDEDLPVVVLRSVDGRVESQHLGPTQLKHMQHAGIGSVLLDSMLFQVPSLFSPEVEEIENEVRELRQKVEQQLASGEDRERLLQKLKQLQTYLVAEEERVGRGPLLSEAAKVQIAFLEDLAEQIKRHKDDSTQP